MNKSLDQHRNNIDDMNLLLLDVFIHGQGWIPSILYPSDSITHNVAIEYNGNQYILDNPSILRWIPNGTDNIIIPDAIFDEVVGESPIMLPTAKRNDNGILKVLDNIPSSIENASRTKVLDLIVVSLLLNYIGAYDYVWKLQGDIYSMREHLPDHWKTIGGITLNRNDERVKKWNGESSLFMKSNFNGMYVPYGLSMTASARFILHENVHHHSEMYSIVNSQLVQNLSCGIIPSDIHVDEDIIHSIAIIGTGRDIRRKIHIDKIEEDTPVICTMSNSVIICEPILDAISSSSGIREDMSIDEIVSILENDDSLIEPIMSIVPLDTMRKVSDILVQNTSILSIIRGWDLYSMSSYKNRLSPALSKILEADDRGDIMEEMSEDDLSSVANSLDIPIPYEDGDISISQLINSIQNKLMELLGE